MHVHGCESTKKVYTQLWIDNHSHDERTRCLSGECESACYNFTFWHRHSLQALTADAGLKRWLRIISKCNCMRVDSSIVLVD